MNFVSAFLLMTCYAASGQLFVSDHISQSQSFIVSGTALTALGVGIFGQALISVLSLFHSSALIPSWSSNPLNTVLVMMHLGSIEHRPQRCMLSVQHRDAPSGSRAPESRQPSLRRSYVPIRHATRFLLSIAIIVLIWAIVILDVSLLGHSRSVSRQVYFYGADVPSVQLSLTALLIIVLFQSGITIGLHIAELIVNITRDENAWRDAIRSSGAKASYGALGSVKVALSSWHAMVLLVLKSVAHWLFGISIGLTEGQMVMSWLGLLPLSAVMVLLALSASFLVRRTSRGSQPVTFGHLQTLCDLIDAWPEHVEQAILWGDKGELSKGTRHAGTSTKILEAVQADVSYAG